MQQENIISNKTTPTLWKLIILCSIASFCALLPANAVPLAAHYFHDTPHHAENLISWYLLGYGIGPLIYAPLSNRYGRKTALYIGMCIALIGMSTSIFFFIDHRMFGVLIGRFISGIGTSSGLVIGMIMLNETAEPAHARKLFSIIIIFFAFAPSMAIACGGYLLEYFGLASIFMLMPILIIFTIAVSSTLVETHTGPAIKVQVKQTLQNYFSVITQKSFASLATMMAIGSGATYVFNGIGPLVAIGQLHVKPTTYGNLAIIPSLGLFLGAIISTQLSKKITYVKSLAIGLGLMTTGGLMMSVAFIMGIVTLTSLLASAFVVFIGAAILIPNSSMTAISSAKDPAIASSTINSTALILSSVVVSLTGSFFNISNIALPATLLGLALVGILILRSIHSANRKQIPPVSPPARPASAPV